MVLLRASEWISVAAFAGFTLLGWRRGLDRIRQAKIAAIAIGAIVITIFSALILPRLVSTSAASATRDWIPCLLLLLFYSQAGQFVTRADRDAETRLERLDQRWVAPCLVWSASHAIGLWVFTCLELAYFSYYPIIPLAVGALYWSGEQRHADFFWTVVLLAAYASCGMLAFVQTRPPRMIGEKWTAQLPHSKMRAFNLWILRHGSVQANTCPSAHVAIATAFALALLEIGPAWMGLGFLAVAVGIALGAVSGRYHYGADAILGFVLAALALFSSVALAAWGMIS